MHQLRCTHCSQLPENQNPGNCGRDRLRSGRHRTFLYYSRTSNWFGSTCSRILRHAPDAVGFWARASGPAAGTESSKWAVTWKLYRKGQEKGTT